jgi:Bacterial Ig-like domain (group 2)
MISSSRRNALFVTAVTVMLISALVGCRGFFVKPTLSSISVTPNNPNLQIGQTLQLVATGNFNDGTQGSVSNVTWTGGNSQVSVSSTGLIKGLANTGTSGGVQITATSGTASGSTTVTVGASSSLTVTSNSGATISITTNGGLPVTFTATQNGTDVTNSATWTSSNTSIITTPSAGSATLGGSTGTVTITASNNGGTGSVTVTVTQ